MSPKTDFIFHLYADDMRADRRKGFVCFITSFRFSRLRRMNFDNRNIHSPPTPIDTFPGTGTISWKLLIQSQQIHSSTLSLIGPIEIRIQPKPNFSWIICVSTARPIQSVWIELHFGWKWWWCWGWLKIQNYTENNYIHLDEGEFRNILSTALHNSTATLSSTKWMFLCSHHSRNNLLAERSFSGMQGKNNFEFMFNKHFNSE